MVVPLDWGDEFLVNTTTNGGQTRAATAKLTDGGFVVVWSDFSTTVPDTSGGAIRAQIYDHLGNRQGGEILVNTTTSGTQDFPDVVGLANGGFFVAWEDSGGANDDVRGRFFDANGNATANDSSITGDDFIVTTTTTGNQEDPAVALLADGNIAVTWEDDSQTPVNEDGNNDTDGKGIAFKVIDDSGTDVIGEALVNTTFTGDQSDPAIAAQPVSGVFSIAFTSDDSGTDTDIDRRDFSLDGTPTGANQFSTIFGAGNQSEAAVTADVISGGFIYAVTHNQPDPNSINPSDGNDILVRQFGAGGSSIVQFRANFTTTASQSEPSIGQLPDGRFFVSWTDTSATGDDTSQSAVRAQLFQPFGGFIGSEFVVNETTAFGQAGSDLVILGDGRAVIVFEDASASGGDTDESAVRGQIVDGRFGIIDGDFDPDILVGHDLVDDVIDGSGGADQLFGLGGDDEIRGRSGPDTITGGDGDDTVFAGSGNDTIIAGEGAGDDFYNGGSGNDFLRFLSTAQPVVVDLGAKTASGADVGLDSFTSIENVTGGLGNDTLTGSSGNDGLFARLGNDRLDGLGGNDTLQGDNGNDVVIGGAGNDTLRGGDGNDGLFGRAGNDIMNGDDGDDIMNGENDGDQIIGGLGNDTLDGGQGNDGLFGRAGDDLIIGGFNTDFMTGNGGFDAFRFLAASGTDTVSDFVNGVDTVQVASNVNASGITTPAAALAAMSDVGGVATLDLNAGNAVTFQGHVAADFSTADFVII